MMLLTETDPESASSSSRSFATFATFALGLFSPPLEMMPTKPEKELYAPLRFISATTEGHPATTLGYRGTHPDARLNFAFDIRCDRATVFPVDPNSGANHAGGSRGEGTSSARARVSNQARRRIGSSSPTL